MADFTAGAVLTAAQLDTAFNTFTINDETGTTYTLAASDAGELVSIANNSGGTVTIPLNATVPFETGTHIHIVNAGTAGTYTIAIAGGGTLNGSATTLAAGAAASVYKTATNTWRVLPFSTGSAAAVVSGTTGSPATSSITGYALTTWTGNGSFTVSTAGLATLLVCAGGGGGGASRAGGAGGYVSQTVYLTAGTYTVTVGAGGAVDTRGGNSSVGSLLAFGGGANGDTTFPAGYGGSGAATASPTGKNIPGQGNIGASGPGGGGGSGGAATGSTPSGVGGVGTAWIDSVTYCVGGSENAAVPGTGYGHGGRGTGGTQTAAQGVVILALVA